MCHSLTRTTHPLLLRYVEWSLVSQPPRLSSQKTVCELNTYQLIPLFYPPSHLYICVLCGTCQLMLHTSLHDPPSLSHVCVLCAQWELICNRSSYPNLSQSGYFLGLMLGAWLFGSLADMYGRKKVLFATLLGSVLMGLGYGLSTGFVMFAICRLLFGMMTQATIVVGYTLLLEVVGASKRSLVATLTQTFFPVGLCVLVILAYFIRNWRILCVLNSLIGLGFLALWR